MGKQTGASRWIRIAAATAMSAGIAAILAGFLYDVLFAGIPYQDPPPDIAADYARHSALASGIRLAGTALLSAGAIAAIACRISGRPGPGTG